MSENSPEQLVPKETKAAVQRSVVLGVIGLINNQAMLLPDEKVQSAYAELAKGLGNLIKRLDQEGVPLPEIEFPSGQKAVHITDLDLKDLGRA